MIIYENFLVCTYLLKAPSLPYSTVTIPISRYFVNDSVMFGLGLGLGLSPNPSLSPYVGPWTKCPAVRGFSYCLPNHHHQHTPSLEDKLASINRPGLGTCPQHQATLHGTESKTIHHPCNHDLHSDCLGTDICHN